MARTRAAQAPGMSALLHRTLLRKIATEGFAVLALVALGGCDVNQTSAETALAPNPDLEGETELTWQEATLTNFESYPDPGSSECIEFSGCDYAGYFAAFPGVQQSPEWVEMHNIAAVHSDDFGSLRGKTLRVREGGRRIDVTVYDLCSDSDCDGCCSRNREETGFLIDLEINTADRFGVYGGVVQWACLDC